MMIAGIVIGAAAAAMVFLLLGRRKSAVHNPSQPWLGRAGHAGAPVLRKTPLLDKIPDVKRRRWNTLTG